MPAETPPADGDRRNRIAHHVRDTVRLRLGPRAIEQAAEGPTMLSGGEADAIADAVLAVRDDELERLRGELEAERARTAEWRRVHDAHNEIEDIAEGAIAKWRQRAEQAEAELVEIKRVTDPPADDDEMPADPAELREMWQFINRQARWQWHMAHKFGEQVERLRAERDAILRHDKEAVQQLNAAEAELCTTRETQRQRAEQAEDRLRAATDAYARLQARADDAEAARDRWRMRAEQAEAERDALKKRLDWAIEQADKQFRARRDAEAAIERVRTAVAIHPFAEDTDDLHRGYRTCSERAIAALDAPSPERRRLLRDLTQEAIEAGSYGEPAPDSSQDAQAELERLRAGEADSPGDPDTWPTPAQWIRRWNDATPEQRLAIAQAYIDLSRAAAARHAMH